MPIEQRLLHPRRPLLARRFQNQITHFGRIGVEIVKFRGIVRAERVLEGTLADHVLRPVRPQCIFGKSPRLLNSGNPFSAPVASVHGHIDNLSMSSHGHISFVERILQISGQFRDRVPLRHARNLNLRDFRQDNAVILGGHCVDPWAGLF